MEEQVWTERMSPRNWTFHPMLSACETGDADAWQAFLTNYTPMMFRLLEVYAPQLESVARKPLWKAAVQALATEDCRRLREFDHQAEREFLMDLKWFVLDLVAQKLHGASGEARPLAESIRSRLEGRPIAHQEIILLNLAGYSPATLEKVLSVPGSLIAKALAPAEGAEPSSVGASPVPPPVDWLGMLREVRAARTPDCPPPRAFVRILDGQASWYDKTPTENHLATCLHCLETWTSLREADSLRRDTIPLAKRDVAEYLSALPAAASAARSWKAKLFGR